MSNNTVPIKKNMLNMSLFSIIFIIFYYLINKINKKYDCFANASIDPTIKDAIDIAVNNKYKADVEAIRNLSSIAHALHTTNNLIVPADLTILGTIKSNKIDLGYNHEGREGNSGKIEYGTFNSDALCIVGKGGPNVIRNVHIWDRLIVTNDILTKGVSNYPANWRGGLRTLDVYASGAYGLGDENGNITTKIDKDGIKSNKIDLGYGHEGRDGNSGKIEYGTFNSDALCIVGKGGPNVIRNVHIWDRLIVTNDILTKGVSNYPANWRGGLRTLDVYASGAYGLGDENGNITTKIDKDGINTNILNVNTYSYFKGATPNNPKGWGTHFPYSDGNNYIRGNTTLNGDIYVSPFPADGGGGGGNLNVSNTVTINSLKLYGNIVESVNHLHLNAPSSDSDIYLLAKKNTVVSKAWGGTGNFCVEGNSYLNKIQIGTSNDGTSNTISDGQYDGSALCIVGKGTGSNRNIHMWDNLQVDKSITTDTLRVNKIIIGNWNIYTGPNESGGQDLFIQQSGGCNNLFRFSDGNNSGSAPCGNTWVHKD